MKIVKCKVNGVENPIGYQFGSLSFSYAAEECIGKKQTEARICVYEGENKAPVYDTGFCTELNSLGTELEMDLRPYTRYFWNVTVRTDAGEECTSDLSYFETAKIEEPWTGRWISCRIEEERHPVFTKSFEASKDIERARLYICGLGLYEARINGKPVAAERFTPFSNDYSEWLQYQTYDVTSLLCENNEIAVTLAPGWYKGRFLFSSKPGDKGFYGHRFQLIAEIHITYGDGSKKIVSTDDSWEVRRSNIIFSNIYDGEQVDDTLEELPKEQAEVIEETTPLVERMSIPVLEQENLPAKELIFTPAGEWVYDVGQNFAGGFRMRVHEPKGTKIHLQFGEILQQGNFYRGNLRNAQAEYIYISDGEEHILAPHFTFYGYRYAKVSGVTAPKLEDFTGVAYYSDIKTVGTMTTGDNKLNQLLSNIAWGQKGNFLDVPTDCPQRNERLGWTADTQVFVPTACYLTDSYAFYRKYLYDIRAEQAHNDGGVPIFVPSYGVKEYSSVWSDAVCIIPWMIYTYYGKLQILRDNYQAMKKWDAFIDKIDEEGLGWREGTFHYGDWLALDNPNIYNKNEGGTNTGFIAEVYRLNNINIIAKSARLLGYTEEAELYEEKASQKKKEIQMEYFTASGRMAVTTQTAYILALYFDVAPDRAKVVKALVDDLRNRGNKFQTGFTGTPFICRILSAEGYDDLAYRILHNEEFPGWLYSVNLGATTIWERWNSVGPDGMLSSTGMNSLNHYAYGSIGEWMWQTMAGISAVESVPGFKKVRLRPIPDWKTGFVDAVYEAPAGTYKVNWKVLDEKTVELHVTVPFDCEAVLSIPDAADLGEQVLTAGSYHFVYHKNNSLIKRWSLEDKLVDIMTNTKMHAEMIQITKLAKRPSENLKQLSMKRIIETYETLERKESVLAAAEALLQKYNEM